MNTTAFRSLSYGLYIVSSFDSLNNRPTGCVANSIMQVTSSPATLAASINHDNYTNSCIKKHGYFAVGVLGESSDPTLIGGFGFRSGKDKDVAKFEGVAAKELEHKLLVPSDVCAFMLCRVIDTMEAATHTVFLAEIIDADTLKADSPMTYAYYHGVIKGKSPKNAPTYLPEDSNKKDNNTKEEKKVKYVCMVCGYVYDGETPFEQLPDDWTCPLCGAGKDQFEAE